jgi:alanyl-tRNA synthetase
MQTEKLYWDDPFATAFESPEATPSTFEGKPSIVLPRTRFYPEAGGQLGDTGVLTLSGARVIVTDTQIDAGGVIHHLVEEPIASPDRSGAVTGEVDRVRRLDHMAHHTAQHMLSGALAQLAHADTVSARLGRASCTLDLAVPHVHETDLARAEELVNAVIRDDVPIRAFFPTDAELAGLKLRRAPKVTQGIRVIDIEGFDQSPCGGTHCTRTGQVGVVRVSATERYKGKVRVSFHAATRALADARAKDSLLAALMSELTCGAGDVPSAVGKLKTDLSDARQALGQARAELANLVADQALAAHPPVSGQETRIVVVRDRDDVPTLRALAGRLASREDVIAICVSRDAGGGPPDLALVVQRGSAAKLDCGAWLTELARAAGGRGGGRPERAEGRLPVGALHQLGAQSAALPLAEGRLSP